MSSKPMTGTQLRDARNKLGMNIRDFAETVGINKGTVSQYENDKSPIPKYVHLSVFALEIMSGAKPKD